MVKEFIFVLAELDPTNVDNVINTLAAFLSGFGSVITAYLGIRFERKRSRQECDDRIKAFREGMKLGRTTEERKK
jgi:hypothetical protein